ncbi:D-alanine--D-alanine ligase [Okeania sp.]|uniref:D-alanine--D-alanine ligase family protein n=1 Tax=Okeania sp. TaxID=3100323 RepID=UPI002B4B6C98|nr:D-alanine--D-alanine ligase [Okeania sp.]MEB3343544.1 D-alanine--D-alanine ligase [Okeania sp.]
MKSEIVNQNQHLSSDTTVTLRVLHLAGSRVSNFYYNLSILYAKEVVQPVGVSSYYAVVHPDGFWQLGASLDSLSEKISFQDMIPRLPEIDVVIPHMFCFPGMTSFRAFFEDMLGIPVVGSASHCTALATNKAHTRNIVSVSGVQVAKAQQLRRGDTVTMKPPFVVKPTSEDNSLGITLVWDETGIEAALDKGFELDDTLLVEDYIPGRELRVGVVERKGEWQVLPMIEYLVTKENPIRTLHDKLELGSDGTPEKQPEKPVAKQVCPANVTPELFEKVANAAKTAHIALGCRDYSLYDFRVHEETNEPYLLEAGLFWAFGKISMISRMLEADGQSFEDIALELWTVAAKRTRVAGGSTFKYVNRVVER